MQSNNHEGHEDHEEKQIRLHVSDCIQAIGGQFVFVFPFVLFVYFVVNAFLLFGDLFSAACAPLRRAHETDGKACDCPRPAPFLRP